MACSIYLQGVFKTSTETISVINPHTGTEIEKVYTADKEMLEKAIAFAWTLKKETSLLTSEKRSQALLFIADEIKKQRKEFAELISLESGKPMRYALSETDRGADTFLIASEEVLKITDEKMDLERGPASKGKKGIIHYFPVGVIAGITPFNFPLNLVAHKVAPAIAAGCPIILKPASSTLLTALKLAEIIDRTELPKGILQVAPCNRETGNLLVKDERISLLSFTGSPDVGWEMKNNCGKKKVVLELGGNAGTYIDEDADLEFSLTKCVSGGFAYSGQICIHAQRIYVHEKLFDLFSENFIEKVKNLKRGNPIEETTEIAEMIDEKNAARTERWTEEAKNAGAKILCGGKRDKNYMEPTVLTETNTLMKVNAEEVFGPVVILEKCKDFTEGIEKINASRFGLQAGVFTKNEAVKKYAFHHLEVGGVIINDVPTFRVDHMPYGGIKDSGLGREGIKYAMMDYMEPKLLVE
jgi:acyl-CoA reductase-like NAD-dependent aldehyde dehydrogenase